MPKRTTRTTGREKTGHADSPRQDSQRPEHSDHADVGGEESTTSASDRTQRSATPRPPDAPPAPGERHPDPPLPTGGRQPQRPGQDARAEDALGEREDVLGKGRPPRRT